MADGARRIYQQSPFPEIPLDQTPRDDLDRLFLHSMVTPFYIRDQKVVPPEGKSILDAGCGTGFKSCLLAAANPRSASAGDRFLVRRH